MKQFEFETLELVAEEAHGAVECCSTVAAIVVPARSHLGVVYNTKPT